MLLLVLHHMPRQIFDACFNNVGQILINEDNVKNIMKLKAITFHFFLSLFLRNNLSLLLGLVFRGFAVFSYPIRYLWG